MSPVLECFYISSAILLEKTDFHTTVQLLTFTIVARFSFIHSLTHSKNSLDTFLFSSHRNNLETDGMEQEEKI